MIQYVYDATNVGDQLTGSARKVSSRAIGMIMVGFRLVLIDDFGVHDRISGAHLSPNAASYGTSAARAGRYRCYQKESQWTTKRCTKCGVTKELGEFSRDKSRKDGLQPHCKECDRAAAPVASGTHAY